MRTFNRTQDDRKVLVNRIGELTGNRMTYSGMPRSVYEGDGFTVTREGNLEVSDAAESGMFTALIINTLLSEGLIAGEEEPGLTVSLPTERHTGETLRNLVNLVYTRGNLLNRALGTAFRVDEGLVALLQGNGAIVTLEDFLKTVTAYEAEHGKAIAGLDFEPDKITFGTLPNPEDPVAVKTFIDICAMMNKQALSRKHIQAKAVDIESEKYAMHIWLVNLGMNGPEYKEDRKLLTANLSGHCAFRNEEERQRWIARQEQRRAERQSN